jgi:hypothetical protein
LGQIYRQARRAPDVYPHSAGSPQGTREYRYGGASSEHIVNNGNMPEI